MTEKNLVVQNYGSTKTKQLISSKCILPSKCLVSY